MTYRTVTPEQRRLVEQTLETIKTHPETWYQPAWRCSTGMCFFGTLADQDSHVEWKTSDLSASFSDLEKLVFTDGAPETALQAAATEYADGETTIVYYVEQRLGLSEEESEIFSDEENTVEDLERICAVYLSGEEISYEHSHMSNLAD